MYDVWWGEESGSFTVLRASAGVEERLAALGDEPVMILYTITADTWEQAMAILHEKMGLEPYRPL